MLNIKDQALVLLDFDGLLVNTEEIHYLAYKMMMEKRGVPLTWNFEKYCKSAHYDATSFRKEIIKEFPKLLDSGGVSAHDPWIVLYHEKQTNMHTLLKQGAVHLMPGVEKFLKYLQYEAIPHSVVTHSPDELVQLVREKHPVLDKIPYWITRHDYTYPKPDPECYQLAISRYSKTGDSVIGFEDTPRGLQALMGTSAKPVLVTKIHYPEIPFYKAQGVEVLNTFEEML